MAFVAHPDNPPPSSLAPFPSKAWSTPVGTQNNSIYSVPDTKSNLVQIPNPNPRSMLFVYNCLDAQVPCSIQADTHTHTHTSIHVGRSAGLFSGNTSIRQTLLVALYNISRRPLPSL